MCSENEIIVSLLVGFLLGALNAVVLSYFCWKEPLSQEAKYRATFYALWMNED